MDQLAIQNGPGRQVALVTGASSGIGRATATSLAGRGWNVVLIARAHAGLADVERECAAAGATVLAVEADVSSHRDVEAAFQEAVAKFGRIHAVVQCAAVVAYGRFEDIPAEIFDQAISTNIVGPANVARAALRHFQQFGAGRLVILGSLLGKIAVPFMSPYVTSKWGVHALTRMLQIEARQTPGIRITLVSPGSVNTPAYSQPPITSGGRAVRRRPSIRRRRSQRRSFVPCTNLGGKSRSAWPIMSWCWDFGCCRRSMTRWCRP